MKSDLNLRHLAHLIAVCDNGCSESIAASKLGVGQSVISRNIHALERYFASPLFERNGRRLIAPTKLCATLIDSLRDIVVRVESLDAVAGKVLDRPLAGKISIACTHLQARYTLPKVLAKVRTRFPDIRVAILQAFPAQINELLIANRAVLGICSEKLKDGSCMKCVEAFSWRRIALVPAGHPLAAAGRLSFARLAREPLITYVPGITGRARFDAVFAKEGASPNVVVEAADSDVIKEFTRLGHGVGVVSEIAYEPEADADLVPLALPRAFAPMCTNVQYRNDRLLTGAQQLFVDYFCRYAGRTPGAKKSRLA